MGSIYARDKSYTLQSNGQLLNAAAYRPLIVPTRTARRCGWTSSGKVYDSVQTSTRAATFNDQRAVVLAIQKQPGTNTIEIVNAINRCCRR